MQGLLLRFLETGEIQKVGTDRAAVASNVRVIAATNRNLREMIAAGDVPRRPFLPAERHSPRRATAARAPRRHRRPHRPFPRALHTQTTAVLGARRSRPEARRRCSRSTPGPATSASSRTSSSGWSSPARNRRSRPDDLPTKFGRSSGAGLAEARAAPDRRRRPVQEARSRNGSRSGRRCIRSTCSGRSRAATSAIWSGRGSRRRAATTRSSRVSSTWTPTDYKRFLNFLRKHDCQLPFKEYR